ncbi:MAG: glycosyltransferase family 1 protein [Ferruginibacter sp.]
MKRIIFDCERMKYPDTGIFHYCLQLGQHLINVKDHTREEIALYIPPGAKQLFNREIPLILQNSFHKFQMPDVNKFDIWHCTYQNTNYLPFRSRKIKVVLTIHDLNFIYDDKKTPEKKRKHLQHLQDNIERSDVIICISDFCKSDVLHYCDTNKKRVHTIYNGTNALIESRLTNISYKPSRKFLFSIGVVTRKKNFHALLPLLENNEMELLIAGKCDDADYLNYITELARERGVENNLRFLGSITEKEKSWYYENCYAFASPSVAEGFCMPLTEAMSVGKPLFLSSQTALPEIGGKVAFYFTDFSSHNMQEVFFNGMDEYHKLNMHDEIKKRGLSFCWNKAANEYLEIYRSL